jgi:hypothetical protein
MTLSTGLALPDPGSGDSNGGLFGQPHEAAPSGFYSVNPTFQAEREMQAYVIIQDHNPPVAQSTAPFKGLT